MLNPVERNSRTVENELLTTEFSIFKTKLCFLVATCDFIFSSICYTLLPTNFGAPALNAAQNLTKF